jgi:iron(III) transport system ATP-binding protein
MADRIVVMHGGAVEQIGTPTEIYAEPASLFVARFVGHMNFIPATAGEPGWATVGPLALRHRAEAARDAGAAVTLAIRPEEIQVGRAAEKLDNRVVARVTAIQFLGSFTRLSLAPADAGMPALECDVAAGALADIGVKEGVDLPLSLPAEHLRAFPAVSDDSWSLPPL